jgi:Putative porin
MQRFRQFALALVLALTPMMARAGDGPERPAAAEKNPNAASAELSALEGEVQELRDLLAGQARQIEEQSRLLQRQQQTMDALAQRLLAVSTGGNAASTAPAGDALAPAATAGSARQSAAAASIAPASGAGAPQAAPAAAPPQDDITRRIEERVARIGPFAFSGDLRLRDEPFFGGPGNQSQVRNRGRIRARLYANVRLNDEISGGLALASGHIEDPISANQDLDQFYTRKPFALDRAFITYNPRRLRPLTLTAGKFAIPWVRTELTWDNDVNVEGAAQTLNFTLPDTPVLKRIALVGFELPFTQSTGVNFNFRPGDTDRSIHQSVVYGGQLQTEWQLAPWLKLSAYTAFYNWHNADPIALSVNTVNSSSPNRGTLRLGGFSLQNSVTVWTQTTSVPATAGGTTNVNTAILNAQFASQFGLLDTIARFDVKTASAKWPVTLLADFVQNTKACANAANFLVPAPAAGATIAATTNAPCNPRDRQAYWLEGRFGRSAEQGDWQFAYTRMFIEREAVLGAYNFSDLRQATNVSQHRVEAFYNALRNVQLGFTGLFGRPLQSSPPAETILKRLQLDVVYRF